MIKHIELEVNGRIIRGYLDLPTECPKSIVVMFHGFTGHKVENGYAFRTLSRLLSKQNIASIRMDFSGSGDSDGEFHEFTFSSQCEEARNIIEYAKKVSSNLSILGFSMGGAVASVVSLEYINDIKKLLLWAPAGNLNLIAKRIKGSAKITPNHTFDMGGYELSQTFCDEIEDYDIYHNIHNYTKDVLIIHGENDQAVDVGYGKKYYERYPNATLKVISEANHVFSSLAWREELYQLSINYLKD
jgi:esterase/lipase